MGLRLSVALVVGVSALALLMSRFGARHGEVASPETGIELTESAQLGDEDAERRELASLTLTASQSAQVASEEQAEPVPLSDDLTRPWPLCIRNEGWVDGRLDALRNGRLAREANVLLTDVIQAVLVHQGRYDPIPVALGDEWSIPRSELGLVPADGVITTMGPAGRFYMVQRASEFPLWAEVSALSFSDANAQVSEIQLLEIEQFIHDSIVSVVTKE